MHAPDAANDYSSDDSETMITVMPVPGMARTLDAFTHKSAGASDSKRHDARDVRTGGADAGAGSNSSIEAGEIDVEAVRGGRGHLGSSSKRQRRRRRGRRRRYAPRSVASESKLASPPSPPSPRVRGRERGARTSGRRHGGRRGRRAANSSSESSDRSSAPRSSSNSSGSGNSGGARRAARPHTHHRSHRSKRGRSRGGGRADEIIEEAMHAADGAAVSRMARLLEVAGDRIQEGASGDGVPSSAKRKQLVTLAAELEAYQAREVEALRQRLGTVRRAFARQLDDARAELARPGLGDEAGLQLAVAGEKRTFLSRLDRRVAELASAAQPGTEYDSRDSRRPPVNESFHEESARRRGSFDDEPRRGSFEGGGGEGSLLDQLRVMPSPRTVAASVGSADDGAHPEVVQSSSLAAHMERESLRRAELIRQREQETIALEHAAARIEAERQARSARADMEAVAAVVSERALRHGDASFASSLSEQRPSHLHHTTPFASDVSDVRSADGGLASPLPVDRTLGIAMTSRRSVPRASSGAHALRRGAWTEQVHSSGAHLNAPVDAVRTGYAGSLGRRSPRSERSRRRQASSPRSERSRRSRRSRRTSHKAPSGTASVDGSRSHRNRSRRRRSGRHSSASTRDASTDSEHSSASGGDDSRAGRDDELSRTLSRMRQLEKQLRGYGRVTLQRAGGIVERAMWEGDPSLGGDFSDSGSSTGSSSASVGSGAASARPRSVRAMHGRDDTRTSTNTDRRAAKRRLQHMSARKPPLPHRNGRAAASNGRPPSRRQGSRRRSRIGAHDEAFPSLPGVGGTLSYYAQALFGDRHRRTEWLRRIEATPSSESERASVASDRAGHFGQGASSRVGVLGGSGLSTASIVGAAAAAQAPVRVPTAADASPATQLRQFKQARILPARGRTGGQPAPPRAAAVPEEDPAAATAAHGNSRRSRGQPLYARVLADASRLFRLDDSDSDSDDGDEHAAYRAPGTALNGPHVGSITAHTGDAGAVAAGGSAARAPPTRSSSTLGRIGSDSSDDSDDDGRRVPRATPGAPRSGSPAARARGGRCAPSPAQRTLAKLGGPPPRTPTVRLADRQTDADHDNPSVLARSERGPDLTPGTLAAQLHAMRRSAPRTVAARLERGHAVVRTPAALTSAATSASASAGRRRGARGGGGAQRSLWDRVADAVRWGPGSEPQRHAGPTKPSPSPLSRVEMREYEHLRGSVGGALDWAASSRMHRNAEAAYLGASVRRSLAQCGEPSPPPSADLRRLRHSASRGSVDARGGRAAEAPGAAGARAGAELERFAGPPSPVFKRRAVALMGKAAPPTDGFGSSDDEDEVVPPTSNHRFYQQSPFSHGNGHAGAGNGHAAAEVPRSAARSVPGSTDRFRRQLAASTPLHHGARYADSD